MSLGLCLVGVEGGCLGCLGIPQHGLIWCIGEGIRLGRREAGSPTQAVMWVPRVFRKENFKGGGGSPLVWRLAAGGGTRLAMCSFETTVFRSGSRFHYG